MTDQLKSNCTLCNGIQTVLIATRIKNKNEDVCFQCYEKHYGKKRAMMFMQDMPRDWLT